MEVERIIQGISSAQRSMWLLSKMYLDIPIYNDVFTLRMKEENIDINKVTSALDTIVIRHESLRTVFSEQDGLLCQKIITPFPFPIEIDKFENIDDNLIKEKCQKEMKQRFNLEEGPLIKGYIFWSQKETILFVVSHHIILDGTSVFNIIVPELEALYDKKILDKKEMQYADYINWQKNIINSPDYNESLNYWRTQLNDLVDIKLPTDYTCKNISYDGERVISYLPQDIDKQLKLASDKFNVSLFTILLSAVYLLFYKYFNQYDIVLGTISSGRIVGKFEKICGNFINPLALRVNLTDVTSLEQLINKVNTTALEAYINQTVPFDMIVADLNPERVTGRNPIFQVPVVYQPPRPKINHDWDIHLFDCHAGVSKFELSFTFDERQKDILLAIEYRKDLFKRNTVLRMQNHLLSIISQFTDSNKKIADIKILTPEEEKTILNQWSIKSSNSSLKPLHKLFEDQVKKTPDNVAVVLDEKSLTYIQLNNFANQLADTIRQHGIQRNDLVAIYMDRCIEMVVCMLAILKVGAGYVPVDSSYPIERIQYMISNCACKLVISNNAENMLIKEGQASVINIRCEDFSDSYTLNLDIKVDLDDTAYCIYTSGTTGRPKGSLIPHQAIANHMLWMSKTFNFSENDVVLQKTPFSFDASIWEFYAPLLCGGKLVIAPPDAHKDVNKIVDIIDSNNVTVLQGVPSFLNALSYYDGFCQCKSLRYLFSGGEPLPIELVGRILSNMNVEMFNLYGPTEVCIDSTYWKCSLTYSDTSIAPIGRPVDNCIVHILNEDLQPVPVGISGELYIGGIQLSKGYIGNDQLNKEKFKRFEIQNSKVMLYRTGDIVKWNDSGEIIFLGRVDNQIKFHGYRIEFEEIENCLINMEGLEYAAVVLNKTDQNNQKLIAFVKSHNHTDKNIIMQQLNNKLPQYMIPSDIIFLNDFPIAANGKIDRRKLSQLEFQNAINIENAATEEVQDLSEIQEILLDIWKTALKKEHIHIHDNFFELGGDSFLSMLVQSYANREGIKIYAKDLIEHKTIYNLSKHILEKADNYITDIQQRLLRIWSKVLCKDSININDNFFEIGGDSLLSMLVQSHANREGIKIYAKDLLEHQTIQDLSLYVVKKTEEKENVSTNCEEIMTVPMTSAQYYVCEISSPDHNHFAMSSCMVVREELSVHDIEKVVQYIIGFHGSLRSQYHINEERGYITNDGILKNGNILNLPLKDISSYTSEQRNCIIQNEINAHAQSFNISTGNVIKGTIFKLGVNSRILALTIHYLAADGVSWRIINEDFQVLCEQIISGKQLNISNSISSSYLTWAAKLNEYIESLDPSYWVDDKWMRCIALPIDYHGENSLKALEMVCVELNESDTTALITSSTKKNSLKLMDVFLVALAETFSEKNNYVSVNMEGFGRELNLYDVNLTRTVGCFTVVYPVLLWKGKKITETIAKIQSGLSNVERGIHYSLIRYLHKDPAIRNLLDVKNHSQVSFNYMGIFNNNTLSFSRSNNGKRNHYFEIDCYVENNCFKMCWKYCSNLHDVQTVRKYAEKFIGILKQLF